MPEDDFVADIAITIAPNPCVGLAGFAVHALNVTHSFALLGWLCCNYYVSIASLRQPFYLQAQVEDVKT